MIDLEAIPHAQEASDWLGAPTAHVVKGRDRDNAWFAIVTRDSPTVRTAFQRWLALQLRDDEGRQRQSLAAPREAAENGSSPRGAMAPNSADCQRTAG